MIVLPMAGLSQRFFREGYDKPKFMLDVAGRFALDLTIGSFADFIGSETFLFVCRDVFGTPDFVRARATALGIRSHECVVLAAETAGQAETVALGIEAAGVAASEPLTIFNIDTFRIAMPDYRQAGGVGCLEVFRGTGDNWSFVEPEGTSDRVVRTTEKDPISDLCCTGLYHFATAETFRSAYRSELQDRTTRQVEHYIAPIYNHLIRAGLPVTYREVPREDVVFCGVPDEYRQLQRDPAPIAPLSECLARIESAG